MRNTFHLPSKLPVNSVGVIAFLAFCFVSCEPEPTSISEPFHLAPQLRSLALGISVINTDTINIGPVRSSGDVLPIRIPAWAFATHKNGSAGVGEIRYRVLSPEWIDLGVSGTLQDNGIDGDAASGDSIYSGNISFSILRSNVGSFHIEVVATGDGATQSSSLSAPVLFIRANSPPAVSNVNADSSVSLSSPSQQLLLTIDATDPDGAPDIQKVMFDSFRPGGIPSSNNPFQMFDNGDISGSGDVTAGDGKYSLRVFFTGAQTGTYTFKFKAVDRSLDTSNVITHFITVTP